MSMLSSVAERLYWTARYLERAESTARLAHAYTQFILDIPVGSEPGWKSLIQVVDGQAAFESRYSEYSELNVLRFLIADGEVPGSVRHSINAARENVRTTRDCLPESFWEIVNELRLYVEEQSELAVTRGRRFEFMDTLVARLVQLRGVVHASMSRDQAYQFMQIGRHFECADMTSRVVDVAAMSIQTFDDDVPAASQWLWVNLLRSLSARSAYRREIGPLVNTRDVVDFILKSKSFTRSIHYCLNGIDEDIEGLADPSAIWRRVRSARKVILAFNTGKASLADLRDCIDTFQRQMTDLNDEIYRSWFHR